jgi:hypothetical protein
MVQENQWLVTDELVEIEKSSIEANFSLITNPFSISSKYSRNNQMISMNSQLIME